jgi:L-ascorbate metabolism protein UlaG (beta-lactamase superfamily)
MKITWHGHSCFKVETGSVLLLDLLFKGKSAFATSDVAWNAASSLLTV